MRSGLLLSALGGLAFVSAQSPSILSTTKSGAIPIAPTPFPGEETIEGALVYDGPPVIGFTGPGGNATMQTNNPMATYVATLPSTNFDNATGSLITGSIMAVTGANGTGVMFTVNFTGFPSEAAYGPFVYHIHGMPVPADGNCTGTMGHLDPTNRGELHACENIAPQTCQAGDLSGKHGNITTTSFMTSYTDMYLSTNSSSPYFFGDKSIVIHSTNATRLTCANFTMVMNSTSSSGTSSTSPTAATSSASSVAVSGNKLMFAFVPAFIMAFVL